MSWVPVEDVSDDDLYKLAADRVLVRLRTGQHARLVGWRGRSRRGVNVRLETTSGTRFSAHYRDVEAIERA